MQFKQTIRFFVSITLLAGFIFSALAFGSVMNVRADDGVTPPPPGEGVATEPSIVGGGPADPGEWPWQVALVSPTSLDLYNTKFCGGSLVAAQWVVTAAHCVFGSQPSSQDVVAGIYNLQSPAPGYQRRDVVQIIIHPNYSAGTEDSDIALLKLSSPVTLGGSGETKTALIPLVPSNVGDLNGINSWVTGWGNTESVPQWPTQLYEVQVPIISNATCNDVNHYNGSITANMLCAGLDAGGKDSCQGDSGGPLVVDVGSGWQLAGIVSWGIGCADPLNPGVYTRVSNFTDWVHSNIQPTPTTNTITLRSFAAYDGWVLESGETSDVGGTSNVTGAQLFVGDTAANKQYRGILSFDTSSLPDNATITSVTLKLRNDGFRGTNPFTTHGLMQVDIRIGSFSDNPALQIMDFESASTLDGAMTVSNYLANNWYVSTLGSGNFGLINLTGITQFRLRFTLDDNNDLGADYLKIYSGNAFSAYRPRLIIEYTVP